LTLTTANGEIVTDGNPGTPGWKRSEAGTSCGVFAKASQLVESVVGEAQRRPLRPTRPLTPRAPGADSFAEVAAARCHRRPVAALKSLGA
jgi:hypothetical protein